MQERETSDRNDYLLQIPEPHAGHHYCKTLKQKRKRKLQKVKLGVCEKGYRDKERSAGAQTLALMMVNLELKRNPAKSERGGEW
jgi:hypothetical protein